MHHDISLQTLANIGCVHDANSAGVQGRNQKAKLFYFLILCFLIIDIENIFVSVNKSYNFLFCRKKILTIVNITCFMTIYIN